MRNFVSIARNMMELMKLIILPIVVSIIRLVCSSHPTPQTEKAPVVGIVVRTNLKALYSLKLRWPTSRLR